VVRPRLFCFSMVREGIPFVVIPLLLAIAPLLFGYWPISLGFLFIAGFMAFFFRNPSRSIPTDRDIVVAPADGRVTVVRRSGPTEPDSLISIFLSPLNVHINRSPIAGKISDITYKPGKFKMATNTQARLLNEQNTLVFEGEELTVKCTQIAGILARRIVCWKKIGDRVKCGETFGMIKFGSRTDVVLPPAVEVTVEEGMHVKGGVTIVGRFKR
jgi:phosphatidylserine decarboxylase